MSPYSLKPDPLGEPRNAFHVFLFVVLVINGTAMCFGQPTSSAVADTPELALRLFGVLTLGSALMVLAGMYWPGSAGTGLLSKRIGYLGLGFTAIIYSTAIFVFFGFPHGFLSSSISFGLGGICFWQVHRINKRVTRIIATTEFVNRVTEDQK